MVMQLVELEIIAEPLQTFGFHKLQRQLIASGQTL